MKKFIAMLLAALMVVGMFAGCGAKEEAPAADANAEAPAAEAEAAASAIKLGMCGPLTGGAAVYGTAVQAGMQIAVEEINAKGGLQFALNCQDDEHDTEKAANAYNALKDWGMQIMAGPVTTAPSNVVAAECANDEIFMLTPSASGVSVIEYGDNIFQICFTDPNQGVASADYMAQNNLGTTIGVIYDSSDVYSAGIYEKFQAQAEANGLNVACVEAFTADNKADLTTQVTKCKDAGCDVTTTKFSPAKGHDFGDWYETIEPDCVNDGEKERECISCGEIETEVVPAYGSHTDDDEDRICDVCGNTLSGFVNPDSSYDEATKDEATKDESSTDEATKDEATKDEQKPSTNDQEKPSDPVVDKGILGDVNGDGKVNIKDATQNQKFAAKIIDLSDEEFIRADVNADGKVNIKDATAIQKFVAKIETGLPIGEKIG